MSPLTQLVLLYKHCMYKYLCSLQLLWVCLCRVWHVWNQLQVAVCSNHACHLYHCFYHTVRVCSYVCVHVSVDAFVDRSVRVCVSCAGISMHVRLHMFVVHVYICVLCAFVCVYARVRVFVCMYTACQTSSVFQCVTSYVCTYVYMDIHNTTSPRPNHPQRENHKMNVTNTTFEYGLTAMAH